MGDRSDREYKGPNDPRDWQKGIQKGEKKPLTYEEKAANDAAYAVNKEHHERNRVARDQLTRFRKEADEYSREYSGDVYAASLKVGAVAGESMSIFTIFMNAGLGLDKVRCSSRSFPEYRTLYALIEAASTNEAFKKAVQSTARSKLVKDDILTVYLTEAQYQQLVQFYSPQKPGQGPGVG